MYEIGMFLQMHFKCRFKPYWGNIPTVFLPLKRFICYLIELLGAGGAPIKCYNHLKLASPNSVYITIGFTLQ